MGGGSSGALLGGESSEIDSSNTFLFFLFFGAS
jgi:hypothetical protein